MILQVELDNEERVDWSFTLVLERHGLWRARLWHPGSRVSLSEIGVTTEEALRKVASAAASYSRKHLGEGEK